MTTTTRPPLDRRTAVTEVGWIAREARALVDEQVPPGSARREAYMERKQALLEYVGGQA
jgi:hypothetical protein